MYLVEEFRDKMHLNLPLRSLEQAISNTQVILYHSYYLSTIYTHTHSISLPYIDMYAHTLPLSHIFGAVLCAVCVVQVIDGFPVHRTTDIRDSVAYLTLLTRRLCTHYSVSSVMLICIVTHTHTHTHTEL